MTEHEIREKHKIRPWEIMLATGIVLLTAAAIYLPRWLLPNSRTSEDYGEMSKLEEGCITPSEIGEPHNRDLNNDGIENATVMYIKGKEYLVKYNEKENKAELVPYKNN